MNLIFIHPNFPAQFRSMAEHLGRHPDNDVRFITANPRPEWEIPGIKKEIFTEETPAQVEVLPGLKTLAGMQQRGEAVAKVLLRLRQQGFKPDVIVGASGWGSTLFVKDVYPEVPFLGYFEWYYDARLPNARFGKKEPVTLGGRMELRERSQGILSDLVACDHGICPTGWQKAQFPKEFHPKLSVAHEGVNTGYFKPSPGKKLVLPDLDLSDAPEIVTYTARGFEPYRGFPQFIESIPGILERRPDARVVIVGQDRICYGPKLPEGRTYKKIMTEKVALDPERVHFVEPLPYGKYLEVLQASTVHVYLTVPFVLSWSLLEAMSCGCLVVASDTQPVKEVIRDGVNGVLAPFFDTKKLAEKISACLEYPSFMDKIRENARKTVETRYPQNKMLEERFRILYGLVNANLKQQTSEKNKNRFG